MAKAPTVWKSRYQINPPEDTDPVQDDLAIVDIGGGGHIAVYTGANEIKGQVFDAEGNRIGLEINLTNTGQLLEFTPALASRPGGGFVIVYQTREGIELDSASTIVAKVFDADLNAIGGGTVEAPATNTPASTDTVHSPSVAMQNDGSFLISYLRKDSDGTYDVMAKRVNADQFITDEITIYDSGDTEQTSVEVAALTNGTYVIVYEQFFDATESDPRFKIVNADIGQILDAPIDVLSTDEISDVQVAALKDGRFVVVWQTDDDGASSGIKGQVYFNNGAPDGGVFTVNTTTNGSQIQPDVAALADGGFIVTWDDQTRDNMYAQRFDQDGAKVDDEFLAGVGDGFTSSEPVAAGLADGRFIIGYEQFTPQDVFGTIFDARDDVIKGTDGKDVLTSRKDGATVKGRDGNDTLLGQSKKDILEGGKGKDVLLGRNGNDKLIGDAGKDELLGGKGNDKLTGGKDKDAFYFHTKLNKNDNVDKITDFEVKKDTIVLDGSIFEDIGNNLSKKEFEIGSKADDKKDRIIYDKKDGDLFYDKNGSKSGGKTLFAQLDKKLKLDHNDFEMIF